ncbi:hypothetical protein F7725_021742 [Dissostichus mawsoni]|uniref:Uncharacterized protein n=1 Tax=Dissostichus mawsoni TaxID=36200 RepID=A0A7J5ZCQ1_DISMA|nr:hypothetical protein F7725_021742 [Dissostichus mawsoni]
MDHSLLHSHMDGSHNRGSPSIPPCNCHSGLPLLQAYRCSFRWRGRRESRLQSGRPLSPRGVRGCLRSLGVSVEAGFAFLTLMSLSVVQTVTNSPAALARLSPRRPVETAAVGMSITLTLCRPSVRQLAARVGRCREDCSAHKAASLHDQVIDGKVSGWEVYVGGGEVFGLAGTRLALQQPDPYVGHPQLLLALQPERVQGLPFGEDGHIPADACLPLLHPKGVGAVSGVVLQHLPRPPKVLRPLQGHGGRPGRAKHHDEMREVELCLQVQLHRFRLHPLRRLPPGVGVTEGGVGHGVGQVGQEGQAGVALGALCGAAGQVDVGVGVGAVELRAVVSADGLRQDPPTQSQVTHGGLQARLSQRGDTPA